MEIFPTSQRSWPHSRNTKNEHKRCCISNLKLLSNTDQVVCITVRNLNYNKNDHVTTQYFIKKVIVETNVPYIPYCAQG